MIAGRRSKLRDDLDDACREDYLPGMFSFVRSLPILIASLMLAVPAAGQDNLLDDPGASRREAPSSDRAVRSALPPSAVKDLDAAFEALAAAKDAMQAHGPEQRVLRLMAESGSDTVDLLMRWSHEAMAAKRYGEALDVLDQVILLKPDYAEGYNRRATIYYVLDDYTKAMADIRATLQLQPRHFGALSGLAAILSEIGETERAEEIYRRTLEIHPNLESARTGLEKLEETETGSPI